MRILFLCARYSPEIGGVEKHVFEITRRLAKLGHEILIITEDKRTGSNSQGAKYHSYPSSDNQIYNIKKIDKSALSEGPRIDKTTIYYLKFGPSGKAKLLRIWWSIWKLKQFIQTSDVIHCHDVFIWYLPFRFIFPFKKVYTTFHGYESYPIRSQAKVIRKLSEKLSFGNICIGEFIKKWYHTVPTFVSYGGTEVPRSKIQIPNNSKYQISKFKRHSAIFVGRLDEQTGILTYLEAVRLIRKKHPKFEFTIVGDGRFGQEAKKVGKVLGFKTDIQVYLYTGQFAFISRYLGMLEAMVAKRLVIAVFDNPVKKDYLKMSPFASYADICSSPDEVAQQVLYYLKHPQEQRKKVEKAYRWASQQTWEKVVKLYLKLWKA